MTTAVISVFFIILHDAIKTHRCSAVCFHADAVAVFSLKQTDSRLVMSDCVRRSAFVLHHLLLCRFPSLCSQRAFLSVMILFLEQPDVRRWRGCFFFWRWAGLLWGSCEIAGGYLSLMNQPQARLLFSEMVGIHCLYGYAKYTAFCNCWVKNHSESDKHSTSWKLLHILDSRGPLLTLVLPCKMWAVYSLVVNLLYCWQTCHEPPGFIPKHIWYLPAPRRLCFHLRRFVC